MRIDNSTSSKLKIICLLAMISYPSIILAEAPDSLWVRPYLRPYDNSIEYLSLCTVKQNESGFALGGQVGYQDGWMDYWFGKSDSSGLIVLSRFIARGRYDGCSLMLPLQDGGFILGGNARIKVDANGDHVWSRGNHPNYNPQDAIEMDGGDIAMLYIHSLEKVGADGQSIWRRSFDVEGISPIMQSVLTEEDGSFTLAGYTSYDSTADIILIKTNTLGEEEWHRVYDTGQGDVCYDHLKTVDGGYLLIGSSLIKVDSLGREVWSRNFQNSGLYRGLNIGDEFVLADYQFNLIRIDADGEEIWHTDFEFGRYGHCHSLAETGDGGFIMAGESVLARVGSRQVSVTGNPDVLYPQLLSLSAFPNPFNSSTTINYTLPAPGRYAIDVVDIQGLLVTRLSDGWKEAGSYSTNWDGAGLASGQYRAVLTSSEISATQQITLIK